MKQDEIKKAVKEALSDKWREDTSKSITALATQMTAGFAAIHTRQDTANGKLLKHEHSIERIQEDFAEAMQEEAKKEEILDRWKWLTIENMFKVVIALAIAVLLYNTGLN